MELWVAEADRQVVSAGRLEPVPGTSFAGIWGGSTLPEWRRRGIYRALTAERARSALRLGKTLINSDSTEYSRPSWNVTACSKCPPPRPTTGAANPLASRIQPYQSFMARKPGLRDRPAAGERDQCTRRGAPAAGLVITQCRHSGAPRLRAGPGRARSVRVVPAAPRPGPCSRNFDSLLAAKFREKRNPARSRPGLRAGAACQREHGPHGHRAPLSQQHRVITHIAGDMGRVAPGALEAARRLMSCRSALTRAPAKVTKFFDGLELVKPGVSQTSGHAVSGRSVRVPGRTRWEANHSAKRSVACTRS